MQVSGASELASKSQGFSDSTNVKPKEEIVDSYHMDKIRCLCGNSLPTDSMIKVHIHFAYGSFMKFDIH